MEKKAGKYILFLPVLFVLFSGFAGCSFLHDGKGLEHKPGESFIKYGPGQSPAEGAQTKEEIIIDHDHGW